MYAQVQAVNELGESDVTVGNGAKLYTLPDPPSFAQTQPPPSLTAIDLEWEEPFDGGFPILTYTLEIYNTNSLAWETVSSSITSFSYTYPNTIMSLSYTFRMKSVTSVGTSVYSDAQTFTSGRVPNAP